uniref:Uncharacterized protein n=1 Tax=Opuntia streptacantha TaxID=393608 RepID=A0A7C9A1D8_OPUST
MKSLFCLSSMSMLRSELSPLFSLLPMTNRATMPFSFSIFFKSTPVPIHALRTASLLFLRPKLVKIPITTKGFFFDLALSMLEYFGTKPSCLATSNSILRASSFFSCSLQAITFNESSTEIAFCP